MENENGSVTIDSAGRKMIVQPNGSRLLAGGIVGNKGGTGRPPSAVRFAMREAFADRVHILCDIADNAEKYTAADRMKAIDLLGKYGLGARFAMEVAAKMGKRNGDPRLDAEEAEEQ